MICAVVLAAGCSRRMGTQKLVLPYAGSTVVGHVVRQVAAGPVDGILVVVGSDEDAVRAALAEHPVQFVRNPAPGSEMLDSLRCGLRALPTACRGVLACLGDQPGLSPALIEALVAAFGRHGGVVVPCHEGRRGHPVLLGVEYVDRVLACYDGVGLRGLLDDPSVEVHEVPWPTTLADLDTPEDYRRALEGRAQTGDKPNRR